MALNTPAQFGRLQGFMSPTPTPRWIAGGDTVFPNALGLFPFLQGALPTQPSFGAPFLDLKSEIRTTLGGYSPL